jgi:hypothetical protein
METCYKAFHREVLDSFEIQEDRFGFEAEVTAKVAARDWRIYEVGISYSGRTYAQGKKIGWRDGLRALYCIGRYSPLWSSLSRRRPPGWSSSPDASPRRRSVGAGKRLRRYAASDDRDTAQDGLRTGA